MKKQLIDLNKLDVSKFDPKNVLPTVDGVDEESKKKIIQETLAQISVVSDAVLDHESSEADDISEDLLDFRNTYNEILANMAGYSIEDIGREENSE